MTSPKQRFFDIVQHKTKPDRLIAIWNTAPFLNHLFGVGIKEYYFDPAVKLEVQLKFIERFPRFICLPGIWADFGALCEPSAFGCRIKWPDGGGMPTALPLDLEDAALADLQPIDPDKDGLMPQALEQYAYFWEHLDPAIIERYGYLTGVAASFGPMELAAVLVGHARFFMLLMSQPDLVKSMLAATTESVIRFLKAHEKVNGPLQRIALADHLPGQINRELFREFFLPCTNQVIDEFPEAMILYHNEYPIPYPAELAGLKADVFHFGGALKPLQEALQGRMVLMGNLDPVTVLGQGSPELAYEQSKEILSSLDGNSSFLLSSGGGLAPETPAANLDAMQWALDEYARLV